MARSLVDKRAVGKVCVIHRVSVFAIPELLVLVEVRETSGHHTTTDAALKFQAFADYLHESAKCVLFWY